MKKPITVAVVGLGRAGWSIHINKIRDREAFRVIDVADPNSERREEAEKELGCRAHPDLDAMLKATDAEVVVVATPNASHEADAARVLESGRHCLLEKPMAMEHAGALRLIDLAARRERRLFVHHQRRFGPEYRFLREVIDSGVLGRVFEVRLCWGGFARRNDWQTLRRYGGGVLNNTGPHIVDLATNLLDAPAVALLSDMQHIKDAGDVDDHVHIFMKNDLGQNVDLVVTTCQALPAPRTMLLGSSGTLVAHDDKTAKLRYYDASKVEPLEVVEGPAPDRKYGNEDVLPWVEEEREIVSSEPGGDFYDNVAAVLLEGAPMVVTPESAAEVIRIIEWAREGERR